MRIATELYTRSYRPGNSYPCACVRAPVVDRYSVTRTLQKPTFATHERRSMQIDRGFEREKSRNRARPRTSTTSFASRISFFPLFFLRDAITISKVDKRTCGQRSAETLKCTQLRSQLRSPSNRNRWTLRNRHAESISLNIGTNRCVFQSNITRKANIPIVKLNRTRER